MRDQAILDALESLPGLEHDQNRRFDRTIVADALSRLLADSSRDLVLLDGTQSIPLPAGRRSICGASLCVDGNPVLDLLSIYSSGGEHDRGEAFVFHTPPVTDFQPSQAWLKHVSYRNDEHRMTRQGVICPVGTAALDYESLEAGNFLPGEYFGNRFSYIAVSGIEVGYVHSSDVSVRAIDGRKLINLPGVAPFFADEIACFANNCYDGNDYFAIILADGRSIQFFSTRRRTRRPHNYDLAQCLRADQPIAA